MREEGQVNQTFMIFILISSNSSAYLRVFSIGIFHPPLHWADCHGQRVVRARKETSELSTYQIQTTQQHLQ